MTCIRPTAWCCRQRAGVSICLLLALWCRSGNPRAQEPDIADTPSVRRALDSIEQPAEATINDSDREHWSFAPLVAPKVPSVHTTQSETSPGNSIDAFTLKRLRELQLGLAPAASPSQLLRRLTFDLTGLPPTAEALQRLTENGQLPDAYDREVDRLLASPACGEHLAQSWLDLARFAETDGFEHDKVRPEAWRYRDWVIRVYNADLPYDQFMRLQVAGDLMDDPEGALATTFCLAGPDMPDLNDQQERRHNLMNEMTATVGSVFLGLQLGCAACHDHKYDPISQADFYRLRAVLETGVPELQRDKPWSRLQEQTQFTTPTFYHRGDHRQPGGQLTRGVPRIVAAESTLASVASVSHPRLALADWLASSENPLPARVIANRLWQQHFGRALASTPSDLGLIGIEPTHSELLDWLACEVRDQQWSLKRSRRQLLLSATYQARSWAGEGNADHALRLKQDPNNRAYSRGPRRRLSGEMLRDAMLVAADALNRQAAGPSVLPPLADELRETLLPGQWQTSQSPADHFRRSIYVFARRNLRYPIFESFDRPDAGASCPERAKSITATQSLLLFNSEFSIGIAERIAARVSEDDNAAEQAEALWWAILGRQPTPRECKLLTPILEAAASRRHALVSAALALLNSNEFVMLD